MTAATSHLKGVDALGLLEAHTTLQLKKCRQLAEQAALADINAYFKGAGLGTLSAQIGSSLVSAAIAGGQWGFNSLISRLGSTSVHQSELEAVANEILEIVSPHAKLLNYARFRVGAVQSYIAQCDIPTLKLEALLLSKIEIAEFQRRVTKIKKAPITDQKSLKEWLDLVDEFCEFISNSQSERFDQQSSRGKRGTVSTKSISSYSKHWQSYASEILTAELGIEWLGDPEESIHSKFSRLVEYRARSWNELQRDLNEAKGRQRRFRLITNKGTSSSNKLISHISQIGTSTLKITFNLPVVDKDLINPAINLLRGQLLRNPKAPSISVNLESEGNTLIVEIGNPKKDILSDVEIALIAHL